MNIIAQLTDSTCGEACWSAREEICRCSCGGKNHGCLKTTTSGTRPNRTAKINGVRCELRGIGNDVYKDARKLNIASSPSLLYAETHKDWKQYDFDSKSTVNVIAKVRPASPSQLKWFELAPYVVEQENLPAHMQGNVRLLWVRIDEK